jgi:hypothetical protein
MAVSLWYVIANIQTWPTYLTMTFSDVTQQSSLEKCFFVSIKYKGPWLLNRPARNL